LSATGWCQRMNYNGRQPKIDQSTGRCELYNKVNRHPIIEVGR